MEANWSRVLMLEEGTLENHSTACPSRLLGNHFGDFTTILTISFKQTSPLTRITLQTLPPDLQWVLNKLVLWQESNALSPNNTRWANKLSPCLGWLSLTSTSFKIAAILLIKHSKDLCPSWPHLKQLPLNPPPLVLLFYSTGFGSPSTFSLACAELACFSSP